VGEAAATTLALVVHELATNSLKYGALSVPSGTVDVSGTDQEENLIMAWTERGGPPVKQPDGPGGYGSKLLERAMTHQLDGSVTRSWDEAGVVVNLTMNKAFLAR
jgi:two-component sensor histidine kinase